MKKLNERQNNKGFSLVELIVVIAIMVVLVAVLAPVFSKYIESSRRSTDVQNANAISEAVLADFADGKAVPADTRTEVKGENTDVPTGVQGKDDLKAKGDKVEKGAHFYYVYNKDSNTCSVYVGSTDTLDLTKEEDAQTYKSND